MKLAWKRYRSDNCGCVDSSSHFLGEKVLEFQRSHDEIIVGNWETHLYCTKSYVSPIIELMSPQIIVLAYIIIPHL